MCQHEGPPDPALPASLDAAPGRPPCWQAGSDGFALHFPGPFCGQLDLLAGDQGMVWLCCVGLATKPTANDSTDLRCPLPALLCSCPLLCGGGGASGAA